MKQKISHLLLTTGCLFSLLGSTTVSANDAGLNPWSPEYQIPEQPRYTPPPGQMNNMVRPPYAAPGYRQSYRPYRARPPYPGRGYAARSWNAPPPAYRNVPPVNTGAVNNGQYMPPPPPPYGPAYGPSAFYMPGYDPRNDNWNNNNFWGRSGPGKWMHPSKRNLEQGWDDMLNAPSRMGEMPGGWTAPSVSMPNPVDMADQIQENVKDLPEQIRDMDVGN